MVAQDPNVKARGRILRAEIDVPRETLAPGPRGFRVNVLDFDASTQTLLRPVSLAVDDDPFAVQAMMSCSRIQRFMRRTFTRL